MRAGAGRIRREVRFVCAIRDAVLVGPEHRVRVVGVFFHVHEGDLVRLRLGAAVGSPEEGDDLRAGAGAVRGEDALVRAVCHAAAHRPVDGLGVELIRRNVRECLRERIVAERGRADEDRFLPAVLAVLERIARLGSGRGRGSVQRALVPFRGGNLQLFRSRLAADGAGISQFADAAAGRRRGHDALIPDVIHIDRDLAVVNVLALLDSEAARNGGRLELSCLSALDFKQIVFCAP